MIICGDALKVLRTLPDESVNMCVTSPPYYGLRDYGKYGQIGLESTPDAYICRLVGVFREVHRVLKYDGTLFVNIGDSYCGTKYLPGYKKKDLIGIPWMLAFGLRDAGWYLRQEIIWAKPNPMPESVRDRCTKSHEQIFLFSKNKKYYFDADAIKEEANPKYASRYKSAFNVGEKELQGCGRPNKAKNTAGFLTYTGYRNKRDVWTVQTAKYKEAHFATFPEKLIEPCILAGCPEGGVVLDPFSGAGTTGVVCAKHNRQYIGIELNEEYAKMSERRIGEATQTWNRMAEK